MAALTTFLLIGIALMLVLTIYLREQEEANRRAWFDEEIKRREKDLESLTEAGQELGYLTTLAEIHALREAAKRWR